MKKDKNKHLKALLRKVVVKYHKRNVDKIVDKLIKKTTSVMYNMKSRSKKHHVKFDMEKKDFISLIYKNYGKPCKYDKNRQVLYRCMTFDHIVPISKGGESVKSNIQLISKFSNNLKGSLVESDFKIVLDWLNSIDPKLRKIIAARLARGKG